MSKTRTEKAKLTNALQCHKRDTPL